MPNRHELWNELRKQKRILEQQEARVYQLLENMATLVFTGTITSFDEAEDILFELIEMDYYIPAMALHWKLSHFMRQHFPEYGGRFSDSQELDEGAPTEQGGNTNETIL